MKKIFLSVLTITTLTINHINAQNLPTNGQEFQANDIKTIRILPTEADFGNPICKLGESLTLTFDVLDDKYQDLAYSIRHCNSDFVPDQLSFPEFAEGFDNRPIQDYESSFNTHVNYSHYSLTIPNKDIKLTISGNYIIYIYEEDNPETILLARRFMIYENDDDSKIKIEVTQPFLPEYQMNYQQLSVVIDNSQLRIANPQKYLKVYAMQNSDFGTRQQLEISGINNNEIQYKKNNGANIFLGGNEFEFLDAKDVHFRPLGVDAILFQNQRYHYITTAYKYDPAYQSSSGDINGQYYIKNDRAFNYNLESDYIDATFRFDYDPFTNFKIYLYGGLTNYQIDESTQMKWNKESKFWELTITLKQGLHNYKYALVDDTGTTIDFSSGNNFCTQNEYLITIYTTLTKDPGERLVMKKLRN